MRTCPHCMGKGIIRDEHGVEVECPTCQGLGSVTRTQWDRFVAKHPNWHGLLP